MGWTTDNAPRKTNTSSSSSNANSEDGTGSAGGVDKLQILEELTSDIQNYATLKHHLMEYNKVYGTARDNDKFRSRVKTLRNKATVTEQRISKHLTKRLDSMRVLSEAKRKQLQKLNQQFVSLRDEFAKVIRENNQLEKKFSNNSTGSGSSTSMARSSSNNGRTYQNSSGRSYLQDDYDDDDNNDNDDDDDNKSSAGSDDEDNNNGKSGVSAIMNQQLKIKKQERQQERRMREKQQMQQFTHVLSTADAATLDVEKAIALETNKELQSLEQDFLELHECFQDMNTLITEQDESLNIIYDNVSRAKTNVEIGVENIKAANNMSLDKGAKAGFSKIFSLRRFL